MRICEIRKSCAKKNYSNAQNKLFMTINERFNSIIKDLFGGNKSAFASAIGVTPSVVENIVGKRGGKPSFDVLEKVCALAQINAEWLIKGKGSMLLSTSEGNPSNPALPALRGANEPKGIPLVPIEAMAGVFQGEQNVLLDDCPRFYVPTFAGADYLIPINGDSMQPKYNSGDIVACKKVSPQNTFFQWGKVYVLDTAQGVLIKRVFKGEREGVITLVSYNEEYPPYEVELSEVYHMGLVLGVLRSE